MKKKLFMIAALLALFMSLSGCDLSPKEEGADLSCDGWVTSVSQMRILCDDSCHAYCLYADATDLKFDYIPEKYYFQITEYQERDGKAEICEITVCSADHGRVEKVVDICRILSSYEGCRLREAEVYGCEIDGKVWIEVPLIHEISEDEEWLLIRVEDMETKIATDSKVPNYAVSDENIKIIKSTELLQEYGFSWTRVYNCRRFPGYSLIIVPADELQYCNQELVFGMFPELKDFDGQEGGSFYFYFPQMDDRSGIDFLIGLDKVDLGRVKPKKDGIYGTYYDHGEYHEIHETEWREILKDWTK
ncbi:MAG: hypothetical protein J5589_08910 [Firmicutes bacterium]|nr:hypothetical protein [Bacillota bacterium]